jgi:pimeloyl-ACP methyl ester carboxylesterase
MQRLTRQTTKIFGSTIAYWVRNPQAAETVLIIHGFRGNHIDLTAASRHFSGYRVVLFDLPGCGESTEMNVKHTMMNYVRMLEEFCRKLRCKKLNVIGHSFGGTLALLLAARGDIAIDRMVLVSPALPNGGLLSRLSTWYYQVALSLPGRMQNWWLANPLFLGLSMDLMLKKVSMRRRLKMVSKSFRVVRMNRTVIESAISFSRCNVLRHASSVRIPTLIIAGDSDQVISVPTLETLRKRFVSGEMVVLRGDGHLSIVEEPRRVASHARRFLRTGVGV